MNGVRPIVKLFLPFLCGILSGFLLSHLLLESILTQLSFFFVCTIILGVGVYFLLSLLDRRWSAVQYVLWFLAGTSLVMMTQPKHDAKHFSKIQTEEFETTVLAVHQSNSKNSKFMRCELHVDYAYHEEQKIETTGKIIAFIDTAASKNLKATDRLLISARLEPIKNQSNPGEFNLQLFWKTKGFEYQWFLSEFDVLLLEEGSYHQSFFDRLRTGIVDVLYKKLDGDVFAVALGILLGDKSYLNLELKDAFSGAGAMHLLAVSGLHVGIFLVILQWLFKTFGRKLPRWIRFLLIVSILWLYAGITGFSPSVNRAVTMFSFVALGTVLGRRYNSMDGLLASAMILLAINPFYLFDIGFQLSYSAMIGIFLFSPLIERSLYVKQKWLRFLWSGTAVALAAQLTTFPLTLYYFHQFPNYFLVTNLGLMLISGVMMAIGLGLISLGSIPLLGTGVALLFVLIVTALITFVEWVSNLPYAITRGFRLELWEMLLLYLGIGLLLYALYQKRKSALYMGLGVFSFFVIFQSAQAIHDEQSSELIVLNSNDPSFFLRRGKNADLIVLSNKPDIEARLNFVKRSLDVYFGVDTKIHCHERKRGSIELSESDISFELKNALIHIQLGASAYTYCYGDYYKADDLIPAKQVFTGAWVNVNSLSQFFNPNTIWELKDKGSFRIAL